MIKTMNCPFCEKVSVLKERKIKEIIKGIEIEYIEKYYYCEDEEFYDEELSKENYIKATDEYKSSKGLLTSKEIKEIREKYSLSQLDLAVLLGMGEVTVTRYETGIIQEKTHDMLLRIVKDEPHYLVELLSQSNLVQKKKNKIKDAIINCSLNNDIMIDNILGYDYYAVNSKLCGNSSFNKEKLFNILKVFLDKNISLTKTKVAKLLFYVDFLMFKKYDKSITGLAYFHMPYGALPLSYDQIYRYSNLKIVVEYEGDKEKQIINEVISKDCLTREEINVVLEVASKFKDINTSEIVEYMHKEDAYIESKSNEFIDYEYSKTIKDF